MSEAAAVGVLSISTRGSEPSVLMSGAYADLLEAKVSPVTPVDTTGAGDQFAAGVMHALLVEKTFEVALALGNACAGEVITHHGARMITPPSHENRTEEFSVS